MNFLALFFLIGNLAQANERVLPVAQLLKEGYLPYSSLLSPKQVRDPAIPQAHSLSWPVQFQDANHTIGNSMAEFQPFGDPYYHGGCDLRVRADAEIHAPVTGHIEAGHYSYATNPDGSLEKYWRPWPENGDPTYFEVSVIADDGIRYEFHHVNQDNLPNSIVDLLNHGGGRVNIGTLLGHVIPWPMANGYHHTHYNVILPSGIRVNPEYVSPLLRDNVAPQILGVFAIAEDGSVKNFAQGRFAAAPAEFIVATLDKQIDNIYVHPPVFVRIIFASGAETVWDFRQTLTDSRGKFPPLWDFFKDSISSPDGRNFSTDGGYGEGQSLIRLKVPQGATGSFTIEVADMAGNKSIQTGTIGAAK